MRVELKPGTQGYPTPLIVLGTWNADGSPNAMTAAWGGVCSSEPPCMMAAIRKARRTYENIVRDQAFTVHVVGADQLAQADYFGLVSGKKHRKLETVSFHAIPGQHVQAPILEEFPIAMECGCIHIQEIGQHMVLVGEVCGLSVDAGCLTENGLPDMRKAKAVLFDQSRNEYDQIGTRVGQAFSMGKQFLSGTSTMRKEE